MFSVIRKKTIRHQEILMLQGSLQSTRKVKRALYKQQKGLIHGWKIF